MQSFSRDEEKVTRLSFPFPSPSSSLLPVVTSVLTPHSVIVVSNDSVNDLSLIDTDAGMRNECECRMLRINRASMRTTSSGVCKKTMKR